MLEIMDVEKDKNVEIFSIVSIERGALDEWTRSVGKST
jgi:hypothetical protein